MADTRPKMSETLPAKRGLLELLESDRVRKGFGAVINKQIMTPEKMLQLCVNVVRKTPRIMECDPQSVLGSMMTAAVLNLEPNTVRGQCYLIPYKNRKKIDNKWVDAYDCQLQIGYIGYEDMAWRNPDLMEFAAEPVFENDEFERCIGSTSHLKYINARGNPGVMQGAFCFTKIKKPDGRTGEMSTYMTVEQIERIRDRSQTYQSLLRNLEYAEKEGDRAKIERAKKSLAETPWVMFFDRMGRKTPIKRHLKEFPISNALQLAAGADDGAANLSGMADADFAKAVFEGSETLEGTAEEVEETQDQARPATKEAAGGKIQQDVKTEPKPNPETNKQAQPEQKKIEQEKQPGPPVEDGDPGPTADDHAQSSKAAAAKKTPPAKKEPPKGSGAASGLPFGDD